jgi:hypothetical protein
VKLQKPAGFAKLVYVSKTLRIAFLLVLTLLCAGDVWSSSAPTSALSIAELTRRSDVIVLGIVTSIASDWNVNRTAIETRIDLKVEEIFKGTVHQAKVIFYQLGGVSGDTASSLGQAATFVEGERVAVFLFKNKKEKLQLVGFFQGKFSVEKRPEGEMAVRRIPGVSRPADEVTLKNFKLQVQEAIT